MSLPTVSQPQRGATTRKVSHLSLRREAHAYELRKESGLARLCRGRRALSHDRVPVVTLVSSDGIVSVSFLGQSFEDKLANHHRGKTYARSSASLSTPPTVHLDAYILSSVVTLSVTGLIA